MRLSFGRSIIPVWQVFKDRIPDDLKEQERQVLSRDKGALLQALGDYDRDLKALSQEVTLDPKHDTLGRIIPAVRSHAPDIPRAF
jgi:hypothetical protein